MQGHARDHRAAQRRADRRADGDQPVLRPRQDAGELGLQAPGRAHRDESIDEMKHADEMIERILYLDGMPNLQRLGSVRLGETRSSSSASTCEIEVDGRRPLQRRHRPGGRARRQRHPRPARGDAHLRGGPRRLAGDAAVTWSQQLGEQTCYLLPSRSATEPGAAEGGPGTGRPGGGARGRPRHVAEQVADLACSRRGSRRTAPRR